VTLDRDVESGGPIAAEERYTYLVERGPVTAAAAGERNGVELVGQTLLDMQADDYTSAVTQQQSKALMRTLINHYLGDQELHTRQLLRDLQAL
jgi:DNA repair protein RecO (recombination protein O)